MSSQEFNLNIKPSVIIKTVLITVGTLLSIGAITKMRTPLTIITIAFFLAIALNPSVSKISKIMPKGSRALSVAVAYLAVVSFLSLILFTVIPPVTKQISNFANNAPAIVDDLQNNPNSNLGRLVAKYDLGDDVENWSQKLQQKLGGSGSGEFVFKGAQTALGAFLNTITILVLAFFMLVDGPVMIAGLLSRYKNDATRDRHLNLAKKMYHVITGYFNGQVLVASIAATISLLAILVTGWIFKSPLPYPLVLMAIVWACGLIPLIGATLGASIIVIVALFTNWQMAAVLGIFFFVYQQIENATIQPKIQSKAVNMNPLIVLIVVLLSSSLGGLFAAFIALPIAGCLQLLFNDFITGGNLAGSKTKPNNWISRTIKAKK